MLAVAMVVVLAACQMQPIGQQSASPLAGPDSPLVPGITTTASADLAEGTGAVRGRIFSSITNGTVSQQSVSLATFLCGEDAPADDPERTGCFWLHDTANSRYAMTDETGFFVFEDLEPGEYLLFVGDLMWHFAFWETEEGRPIPFMVSEGQMTELGNIILAYPY